MPRRLWLPAVLAVVSAMALAPGTALAQTACGSLSGSGTTGDPCLIGSDADLDAAAAMIDSDTAHTGASTLDYKLTANLDYSKDASNTAGAATGSWQGIDWFSGTFDGDGHTISNLTYTATGDGFAFAAPTVPSGGTPAAAAGDLGFFRVLDGATVQNLTLGNVHVSTSTGEVAVGGVSVWSFGSSLTGVTLSSPDIASTGGGGSSYVGGLVGLSYANLFADEPGSPGDAQATSDGHSTTFTDDSVTAGSIGAFNRLGGITGLTEGPTTISDEYVDTTLANAGHNANGSDDYGQGGLVGTVAGTYSGAAGTAMTDNVIAGTIGYGGTGTAGSGCAATSSRSCGSTNYASPTVGFTTSAGAWTTANNLVSSALELSGATGPGLAGLDGTSVSPATLAAEATFDGAATGQSDPATGATYDELGWNFGAPDPSGWAWTGTAPAVDGNAGLTVANTTITVLAGSAPTDATLLSDVGASALRGTPVIDTGAVNFSADGSYQATISTTGAIADSIQVTIVVANAFITIAHPTATFQASGAAPTESAVLSALGATVAGGSGQPSIDLSAVKFDTPGDYQVTITDSSDGAAPVTAAIQIVPVSIVTVQNRTVFFNVTSPPTAKQVQTAAGAALSDAGGGAVQGVLHTDISAVGSTAGTYTATITGTDQFGFTTQPLEVSVVLSDAAVSIANGTATFQAGSPPTQAALLSALGATITGSGSGPLAVDVSGVDFSQPGSYAAKVLDTNPDDVAASRTATIKVVPVTVILVTGVNVYLPAGSQRTLAGAQLLAFTGAKLTDADGDTVTGTLAADASRVDASVPGIYPATITGTDQFGFTAGPVTVNVVIYASGTGGPEPGGTHHPTKPKRRPRPATVLVKAAAGPGGLARVRLACPKTMRSCTGAITLTTAAKHTAGKSKSAAKRSLILAHAGFKLKGGASESMLVGLDAAGRRLLAAGHGRLRVRVVSRSRNSSGKWSTSTLSLTLTATRKPAVSGAA